MPVPDWNNFAFEAKKQLTQELEAPYDQQFVRFLYEPSFAPHLYMQFTWNEHSVQWRLAQWDRIKDYALLADPIMQLQFLAKPVLPSTTINNGQASITTFIPVINLLQSLQIQPIVKTPGITIDGAYHKIVIGAGQVKSVYAWHTLPNGWEKLKTLAELLMNTIDQLCKPTPS